MTLADLSPLANHLWQSTVCVAVAWLLTLALRKNRAGVRYGIWLAASVKFLVPFAWLAALGARFEWRAAPAVAAVRIPVLMQQIGQPFDALTPAAMPAAAPPAAHIWPAVLLAVWLGGVAVGLGFWLRWWRQVRSIRRAATPLDVKLPIPVMSSPARMEPGVVGIFKPVLLLPEGIAEHLTPPQLQAILAHELRHVERRDNLTAAIHMLVETVFWFHPLVWWIRARLMEERERACDEGVLRMGSEPQVYAESILKVCEFYLASPVACASGITGGELKKRIEGIMENRFGLKLGFGKRALVALAAIIAVASPIAIGLTNPARGRAQARRLTFDVASVKALDQPWFNVSPTRSPGRFSWTTQMAYLVEYAFHMQPFRISGASGKVPGYGDIYHVDATMPPDATVDQIRLMVRSLLEDRFKMVWRIETRDADGWALSVAKNGPTIHEFKDSDPPPPIPAGLNIAEAEGTVFAHLPERGVAEVLGRRVSMQQFCEALERYVETAVWDDTGMKGKYYLLFRYAREDAPMDADAPPLNAALQENLGLKIEKRKGPVEFLVIDHIEKTPTEN